MQEKMPLFNKAVLINITLAVGLSYEYLKGTAVIVIVICAVFLFTVANVTLWLKARSLKTATSK